MQMKHMVATVDWFYKVHILSYLADVMIVVFIYLRDCKVQSIFTQWEFISSFALSLDSTAKRDNVKYIHMQ